LKQYDQARKLMRTMAGRMFRGGKGKMALPVPM
jgi:hypothetical protein